jgi:LmbE family N-acetylglucosaminyl deacetylase
VEAVRPTVIYTHSLHDVNQDHRNTHRAAMVATREGGRVYCFQSPSAPVDFRCPRRFIILSKVPLTKGPETLINRLVRNAPFDKMNHFVES